MSKLPTEDELKVSISGESSSIEEAMDKAAASIENFVEKVDSASKQIDSSLEKTASDSEKNANKITSSWEKASSRLKAIGTGLSLAVTAPLVAMGAKIAQLGIDSVENENLFDVSFKGMANSARQWSQQLGQSLNLNEYALRRQAAMFYTMFNSMGLGTKASYEMSTGLTQLAYDMSSFYNLKPEEAFEKLRAGISGETEPLKELGININDTAIQTYALKTGLVKQGETLSEQGKVLARYGLLLQSTKDAQGDLARTADSPANKLRELTNEIERSATQLGQDLLPEIKMGIDELDSLAKSLKGATDWFHNLSPGTQEFYAKLALVIAIGGPTLVFLGNLVKSIGVVYGAFITLNNFMDVWAAKMYTTLTGASVEMETLGTVAVTETGAIGAAYGVLEAETEALASTTVVECGVMEAALTSLTGGWYLVIAAIGLATSALVSWMTTKSHADSMASSPSFNTDSGVHLSVSSFPGSNKKKKVSFNSKLGVSGSGSSNSSKPDLGVPEFSGTVTPTIHAGGNGGGTGSYIPDIDSLAEGVNSTSPGSGKKGNKGKRGKKGSHEKGDQDAYEAAKSQYEEAVAGDDVSAADKLALYKKYMDGVKKTDKEAADYRIELAKLTKDAKKEQLDLEKADLDLKIAEGKLTDQEAYEAKIKIINEELAQEKQGTVKYKELLKEKAETEKNFKKQQLEAARTDLEIEAAEGKKTQEQMLKDKIDLANKELKLEKEGTQAYKQALKEKVDADKAYFDWKYQQEQQNLERQRNHNLAILSLEEENIRHLKAIGVISDAEEAKRKAELDEKVYQENLAALDKEIAAAKAAGAAKEDDYKKLMEQRQQLNDNYSKQELANQNAIEEARTKVMRESLQTQIEGLLMFQTTWKDAFSNFGKAILQELVKQKAAELTAWILGEKSKTAVTEAETSTQIATQKAGAATGLTAMFKSIVSGFTALFTAMLSMLEAIWAIPIIGPPLAIVASSKVVAGMGKLAGLQLPSFDVGAWSLPEDMVANVHKKEMIIPAGPAEKFRDFMANGNLEAGKSSNQTTHYTYNVNAFDSKDVSRFLKKHGKQLAKEGNRQARNFSPYIKGS